MGIYWRCNRCKTRTENYLHKNSTCPACKKGRLRSYQTCLCGKDFHPSRLAMLFCSKKCAYEYRKEGGKRGKHYPHLRKARLGKCSKCGKSFRALKDIQGKRRQKYCSKECWAHRSPHPKQNRLKKIQVRLCDYRKWREAVFARDNGRCVECGGDYRLEADHIIPVVQRPDLALSVENGRTLCHECHKQTPSYGKQK